MERLNGIQASEGIAIGSVFVYDPGEYSLDYRRIVPGDVAGELDRLHEALASVSEELKAIRVQVEENIGKEHAQIFDVHLMILEDSALVGPTEAFITDKFMNAEHAFWLAFRKLHEQFDAIQNDFFRQRNADLVSIEKRVLGKLRNQEDTGLSQLPHDVVLVARDLAPADTALLDNDRVLGIVTEVGGATSHTAILARGLEIPAVVGISALMHRLETGDQVIVDGRRGRVILDPDEATLVYYRQETERYRQRAEGFVEARELPAETMDGVRVSLQGNIELPAEVESARAYGAEGIGLYRTEYLYLAQGRLPDEETQYAAYTRLAERTTPQPLVIRTLDLGGDKLSHLLPTLPETNPFLGWRAIRLSLGSLDLFRVQLRAILRASAQGNIKIMFPLVSGIAEFRQAKAVLKEVQEDLRAEGTAFDGQCDVGVMIEVPSAAVVADQLAQEADFFSIGTNDLIQYTLAVDRGNEQVAYLFDPYHPAVLRLIKHVIDVGHEHQIPVSVCGEMAGDPIASLLLIGLGIDSLSMTPRALPEVKQMIRKVPFETLKQAAIAAVNMDGGEAVLAHFQEVLGELFTDSMVEEVEV
ncbi:MAG: phosphoenolpyruvate--protein phosphotransferase [Candidatus Latescibacteria bacterium]|jgi:phosphoenolpyruvate-protein phosphotransferase (PTS system enzyme I)|nr:phosphoenolpyruvate--protein phosphotransferase [Candidatus Latescibacterota bacterium]